MYDREKFRSVQNVTNVSFFVVFNAGASERSRSLWPGMNAALTVSRGKHARVMKRVRVGPDARKQEMMYVNIAAYIINNVNNVPIGQI